VKSVGDTIQGGLGGKDEQEAREGTVQGEVLETLSCSVESERWGLISLR
jgi:hypothetical protein